MPARLIRVPEDACVNAVVCLTCGGTHGCAHPEGHDGVHSFEERRRCLPMPGEGP